ncbi:MAG: hypothetical protein K6T55_08200 [Syntrophobacterales bacterium]|nr:hypothetical protein [Syntrophobacterales bacterium]
MINKLKHFCLDEENFSGPRNAAWGIFLVSLLGLFLEMMLIRWISTEIRIFAYLQNQVLIVIFLGLGLGCFTCRQPIRIDKSLIALGILTALIALPWTRKGLGRISEMLSLLDDFLIWHNAFIANPFTSTFFVLLGLIGTYCIMVFLIDIFVPFGRILGRLLDDHPHTIWAYTINITGSLLGIWVFVLFSMLSLPPVIWFIFAGFLLLFFVDWRKVSYLIIIAFLTVLGWLAGQEFQALRVVWSPYQKLTLWESSILESIGDYIISVNNAGYQAIIDLQNYQGKGGTAEESGTKKFISQYDLPFLFHPRPRSCLIVGAGSGNDAAGALRYGVEEIVAVEIDPAIISLGREFHPEKPYSHPAVQVVVDDARSYFANTDKKFDLIIFSLLDSHTTTAMTNARLDHYVYTEESLSRARQLLTEDGIIFLSFEAQKYFIADRMGNVLKKIFGWEPLTFRIPFSNLGWGGVIFVSGNSNTIQKQMHSNRELAEFVQAMQTAYSFTLTYNTKIATDDWPYIYLESPRIPFLFFLLALVTLLLFLRSYYHWGASGVIHHWQRTHWHFFFLGAAFLLLEVQNISKAAVVLGNTWDVNAVIISGVLCMILLSNLIYYVYPEINKNLVYFLLICSCIILYYVDLAAFSFLNYPLKATVVGALAALPLLFSGIIFIRSFARTDSKDEALGANLIGSL